MNFSSLAARRRTTTVLDLNDEHDNSLDDSYSRRQSRLLNTSLTGAVDEPVQTPRQLVDLYQKTVELATQGKINIKNAFNIPLVERLPQVLNVIALDDKDNHNLGPNFVKAGSVIDTSAKIYGFRVDALHTETQKLSGNILNTEEEGGVDGASTETTVKEENSNEEINADAAEQKKPIRRVKAKATTFILNDLSKITLDHEFDFRPLQSPHMCQWRGGIGADSIYAEMVSSTMYSSSDFPLIDGFTNSNVQIEDQQSQMTSILDQTLTTMIDLTQLRTAIKSNETHDHILGSQILRDFVFTETPSESFIDTIHESCLAQIDESIQQDDQVDQNLVYNHDELVHAAIEDLNDEPSQTNDVFRNALNELSNPEASNFLSTTVLSTYSFADQMPNLLNAKSHQSEYSYFDATKLKLFAGPNIWKFTNLLGTPQKSRVQTSIVQDQQAPASTPSKISALNRDGGIGPKRSVRIDLGKSSSLNQIMSINHDRRAVGISQSSLSLRLREKSFNQMQLARKIRPLGDLTNLHNFPDLNLRQLDSMHHRQDQQQQTFDGQPNFQIHDGYDDDHVDPMTSIDYDFVRPIHYEKIEFAKGSSSVNAKTLKRQMIDEFSRQKFEQQRTLSLDTSTSSQQSSISSNHSQNSQPIVEFSILLENLADHGHLSIETDLASAFYCMLINCNENKLYMKSNSQRNDIFIQEQPFINQRDLSTLSYSYTSHSNLSIAN